MRFRWETTKDGSRTLFDAESGESYKSRHAARTESETIYWAMGVKEHPAFGRENPFCILELGFGLGTNFSFLAAQSLPTAVEYTGIDRDLSGARLYWSEETDTLGLGNFVKTHSWRSGNLKAELLEQDFLKAMKGFPASGFHSVFFDPFSPKANPESWSEEIFREAFRLLRPQGRLATYSVSRIAKDAALHAGFHVEKRELPKILQKRHGLLALKP